MAGPVKGRADFLLVGDWNAACSICGRKRKASELVQNWQGLWRCPEHNEPRQPQDFVRGIADIQTPPWTQRETDINLSVCTFNGCSAIPGWAIPGCSIPGRAATQPMTGLFGMEFTSSVGGGSSGVLSEPILFLAGSYRTTFSDQEQRMVTFSGVSASWSPPLLSGQINTCFVNVGTY